MRLAVLIAECATAAGSATANWVVQLGGARCVAHGWDAPHVSIEFCASQAVGNERGERLERGVSNQCKTGVRLGRRTPGDLR